MLLVMMAKDKVTALAVLCIFVLILPSFALGSKNRQLERKKRFLTFPTGSQLTLSACLAKGGIILSPPAFVFTFDWDLAFALPNDTKLLKSFLPAYQIHRRDRRDLYSGMEGLLDRQGLNGRACVLRALCEAQQQLQPSKGDLMEEIFHTMFTLPPHVEPGENDQRPDLGDEEYDDLRYLREELRDHDIANHLGRSSQDCASMFEDCPVSLLQLALW